MEKRELIEEIGKRLPDDFGLEGIKLDGITSMYLYEYSMEYPFDDLNEAVNHLIREGIRSQQNMGYLNRR